MQIQLTSGALNIRVRRLNRDDIFEIDTPNQAFSVFQPGSYRVEASQDGRDTVVSVREGEGESTGNGRTYTLHAGQRGTLSGTESLNADVVEIGGPDEFDNWAYNRDRRYEGSRSARYLSRGCSLVTRIWMTTATGATIPTTGMSGSPTGFPPGGHLIGKATGTGLLPGVGHG